MIGVDHSDYLNPGRLCERLAVDDVKVGDHVWIRSSDGFDPWFIAVNVDAVSPMGDGVRIDWRHVGGDGRLYAEHKWAAWRYLSATTAVYRCRVGTSV